MRQVQEMAVEFVNALNAAAAAAESECAKLRRMLEEEQRLVRRLKQEKEDEAQMARRKIEEMHQRLAEAQKDVEYATVRADVAENEWIKAKKELQEAQELVQLIKPESEETRQSAMRQAEKRELELANAVNAAAITKSECDKLRIMLEEEQKLVKRLELEKDDEVQLAKRQIEDIGEELVDAQKNIDYATARADVAENEWIKAKRELQEERELLQLLKLECDKIRQSAEEKKLDLADALNASEVAERECAKLRRMLEEERTLVLRLKLERDDEVQLVKTQLEEMGQELANVQKDAELARKDADVSENEWIKVKRELKKREELFKLLELEFQESRESAVRKDEEKRLELANALSASAIAEHECAKLRRMLEEEQTLVLKLKLEKVDEMQLLNRQLEEKGQELANARKDAELARKDADVAENEWIKVKSELKKKEDLFKLLELECQEIRGSATRRDEEKQLELANALNASAIAASECAKLKRMLIEEGKTVQRLILEKDDEAELAERKIEEMHRELANVLNAAATAESSSAAQDCAICLTKEKDMAFGCGHMTCEDCGSRLSVCPICRVQVTFRIKLFPG